jgi:2-polyprenyl-3-methyl-5-hydroxy-6-metoxy-1,4-benzoquinol methylase
MNEERRTTNEEFWDRYWSEARPREIDLPTLRAESPPANRVFLDLIGDVAGMDVLDLGCGNGLLSVGLAKSGARVTAIDISAVSIRNTIALAQANEVGDRVDARQLEAARLPELSRTFNLVVGQYILHHIEPFDAFVDVLFRLTAKKGRGVFLENSSRNPILAFARAFMAGRFGIPKYGDAEEHPLEPREIALLARRFDDVKVIFPEFLFLRMIGPYLLRRDFRSGSVPERMDDWIYRRLPFLRRYSYRQIVEVRKADDKR